MIFCRRCRAFTPVWLRPLCVRARQRLIRRQPAGDPHYPARETVQTNTASSVGSKICVGSCTLESEKLARRRSNFSFSEATSSRLDARLCFPMQGRAGIWHRPLYDALCEEDGRDLDAAVAAHPSQGEEIGVFSYEGIYVLPPRGIQIIREKLGTPQIILFIRRQDHAINSYLNQLAKAHRVSFDQVKEFERNAVNYNPEFDYHEIISRWTAAFGVEAVDSDNLRQTGRCRNCAFLRSDWN